MGKTEEFFSTYLPNKLANNPELAKSVKGVFHFKIDGAGEWTLNLDASTVTEGSTAPAGCIISATRANWESILDDPKKAVNMVMMGKLKVSNLGMATSLQKILA
jgi:putative sterol carrier protein